MRISDWSSDVCSSDLDCWFDFEFRYLPEQDGEALFAAFENYVRGTLEPETHAVDPAAGFAFEELSAIPALNIDPGDEVVTFAKRLAGRNDPGKVAFGTEAGLLQTRGGLTTAICGPGRLAQAPT